MINQYLYHVKGPLIKTKYFKILINSVKESESTEVTLRSPAIHST